MADPKAEYLKLQRLYALKRLMQQMEGSRYESLNNRYSALFNRLKLAREGGDTSLPPEFSGDEGLYGSAVQGANERILQKALDAQLNAETQRNLRIKYGRAADALAGWREQKTEFDAQAQPGILAERVARTGMYNARAAQDRVYTHLRQLGYDDARTKKAIGFVMQQHQDAVDAATEARQPPPPPPTPDQILQGVGRYFQLEQSVGQEAQGQDILNRSGFGTPGSMTPAYGWTPGSRGVRGGGSMIWGPATPRPRGAAPPSPGTGFNLDTMSQNLLDQVIGGGGPDGLDDEENY